MNATETRYIIGEQNHRFSILDTANGHDRVIENLTVLAVAERIRDDLNAGGSLGGVRDRVADAITREAKAAAAQERSIYASWKRRAAR